MRDGFAFCAWGLGSCLVILARCYLAFGGASWRSHVDLDPANVFGGCVSRFDGNEVPLQTL